MKSVVHTTENFKVLSVVIIAVALLFVIFTYAHAQTLSTKDTQDNSSTEYTSTAELPKELNVIPSGAPDTGFGGSTQLQRMDSNAALPLLVLVLIMLVGPGVFCAIRDGKRGKELI